jgi:Rhs element Vgr protein
MPSSTVVTNEVDLTSFVVTIDGKELPNYVTLVEVDVKKEINKIPTATIVVLDGHPADVEFKKTDESDPYKPGKVVKISAGYHQKNMQTLFEGVILSHSGKINHGDLSEVVMKCVDKAAKMTVVRKSKYFKDSTDSDAISKIIGENGLQKTVDSTSFTHETMVQFDVTDFDFIITRAESNGLLVVVDDGNVNVVEPKFSDGPVLTLTYGTDIMRMDLEVDSRFQYDSVVARGWDFSNNQIQEASASEPSVNGQGDLSGKALAETLGGKELVLNSSAPIETDALRSWAEGKLLRSRLARIRGKIAFQGNAAPKPNTLVDLKGVAKHLLGEAFVSGVRHTYRDQDWETEVTIGLSPLFHTETQKDLQTPPSSGLMPSVSGLQIGKVQKIHDDPLGENRILVDVPVIIPSGEGIWARQALMYSTSKGNHFWIPELNDEVILGFLNDDPRFPVILGSVPSKKIPGAYTPDDKNTIKAITTVCGQMKIEFEDVKKIITITTPAGNLIEINDDQKTIKLQDQHGNKMLMSDKGFSFDTPKDFVVKATGNIKMESTGKTEIKATQDFSAEGLNVNTKASVGNTMKGATCEVNGSGMTTIKGGLVQIN